MSKYTPFILFLFTIIVQAESDRPNIILIMADDLGIEMLGCYGGASYDTPNLNRLAAEGVRFDDAHSVPLCTPTRVALMTGKYNFRNWLAFGILDPEARTFGHWFSEAGYKTCISGKWQLRSYNPPDFQPEWRNRGMRADDSGFHEYFLWHTEHTEDKASRFPDPRIQPNGKYLTDTEGTLPTSGGTNADLWVEQDSFRTTHNPEENLPLSPGHFPSPSYPRST